MHREWNRGVTTGNVTEDYNVIGSIVKNGFINYNILPL